MERMYYLLDKAASAGRFSQDEKNMALALFDDLHAMLVTRRETRRNPPNFLLATGERAKGATGRVALCAYFLLLGRLALGKDYTRQDERMAYWNMYLGFDIMLGNFKHETEKGFYCCSTCTLSVLPLYCTHAFEAFDCNRLKANVLNALSNRQWRFAGSYSKKYEQWALQFV